MLLSVSVEDDGFTRLHTTRVQLHMKARCYFERKEGVRKHKVFQVVNHGAINMENLKLLCIRRGIAGRGYLEFSDVDIENWDLVH